MKADKQWVDREVELQNIGYLCKVVGILIDAGYTGLVLDDLLTAIERLHEKRMGVVKHWQDSLDWSGADVSSCTEYLFPHHCGICRKPVCKVRRRPGPEGQGGDSLKGKEGGTPTPHPQDEGE